MNDIIRRDEIPSVSKLSKLGVSAVGFGAAGIFLSLLNTISAAPVLGFIAGGIVCLFGIGALSSKDPTDKKAGIIITAAGALTIVSKIGIPLISGFSGFLLGAGAFGLIALGVVNAVKFFIGLKKRS